MEAHAVDGDGGNVKNVFDTLLQVHPGHFPNQPKVLEFQGKEGNWKKFSRKLKGNLGIVHEDISVFQ